MKILHIFDHSIPLHSGYTFRSRAILDNQRLRGWETVHVTSLKHTAESDDEEVVDGFHFYRTRSATHILNGFPVLNQWAVISTLTKRLDRVIEKERPDILHAHSPALNGMAAIRAGKKHGLPVVYECRAFWEDAAVDHGTSKEFGLRYRLTRALETHVFKQAQAVTTICRGLKDDIAARGVSADKITIIPNAVDIEQFRYGVGKDPVLSAELGLQGKIVLGFIGSFYAYEGIPLLLESLSELTEKHPDLCLLLVGGGPQEGLIKEKIKALNLQQAVIMTGRVPHAEVQHYYNLVDIFVYPRLPMRLTDLVTPLKPLEAMAQGKLVVASDVGGHKELIEDGRNGALFHAGDSRSLAAKIAGLIVGRDNWQTLSQQGRKFVEEERNWPRSVSFYEPVYRALIERGNNLK